MGFPFTYAGERDAANKAIPGVANTKGARSVNFLGDEHRSAAEPNAGNEFTGEHESAELG